jgi:hypothetical protein
MYKISKSNYIYNVTPTNNKNLTNHIHFYNKSNQLIYDEGIFKYRIDSKSIDLPSIRGIYDDISAVEIESQIPLFFKQRDLIKIPNKVEYAIRKYLSSYLTEIHPDKEVAKELCLLLLSQLNSTYFDELNGKKTNGWKRLKASYLKKLISIDETAYKRATEVLEIPLRTGAIIEVNRHFIPSKESFKYRLGEAYRGKGISTYQLKTKVALNAYKRYQMRMLNAIISNPICQNLVEFYKQIELPTMEQIEREATFLIKQGYKTKKGKLLKRLNKHSKDYFANPKQYSFVEDGIRIFQYLTENGLMIPSQGSIESGGRINDSIAYMPSWIRNMIKINGRRLVEADFKCLHPNLAISLYGGSQEYLTHGAIANELKMDVLEVKREHLSFFNKTTQQMTESPLHGFYSLREPSMLKRIKKEKLNAERKYKTTSQKLLAKEVLIMTDVIQRLNQQGIYVGYVFDALICQEKHAEVVARVMNEVVLQHGVKTIADTSKASKYKSIIEPIKEKELNLKAEDKWLIPEANRINNWRRLS